MTLLLLICAPGLNGCGMDPGSDGFHLEVAGGTLTPSFTPGVQDYAVSAETSLSSLQLSIYPGEEHSRVEINGIPRSDSGRLILTDLKGGDLVRLFPSRAGARSTRILVLPEDFPRLTVSVDGDPAPGYIFFSNLNPFNISSNSPR